MGMDRWPGDVVNRRGLHWRQWAHPGSTVKVGFSRNFAPVKINLCQAQGVNLEHGKCMPEQGIFVIVQGGLQAINIAKDISHTVRSLAGWVVTIVGTGSAPVATHGDGVLEGNASR